MGETVILPKASLNSNVSSSYEAYGKQQVFEHIILKKLIISQSPTQYCQIQEDSNHLSGLPLSPQCLAKTDREGAQMIIT